MSANEVKAFGKRPHVWVVIGTQQLVARRNTWKSLSLAPDWAGEAMVAMRELTQQDSASDVT